MRTLKMTASDAEILADMQRRCKGLAREMELVRKDIPPYPKREIRPYEAGLLYWLARQYNTPGAEIFEIGTCWGWSAAIMAKAAPKAHIVTCTPNPVHVMIARKALAPYTNVEVRDATSVALLTAYQGPQLDMIFVDGAHKEVRDDLPWYNWLKVGGLMIHHDYSPADAPVRPCRWVWDAVNEFAEKTHQPDVLVVDEFSEGMAGFYRREGEEWLTQL